MNTQSYLVIALSADSTDSNLPVLILTGFTFSNYESRKCFLLVLT